MIIRVRCADGIEGIGNQRAVAAESLPHAQAARFRGFHFLAYMSGRGTPGRSGDTGAEFR